MTNKKWSPEEIEQLKMLIKIHSGKEIAHILGRGENSIYKMVQRLNLKCDLSLPHVWNEELISMLKKLTKEGYTLTQISEKMGLTYLAVRWKCHLLGIKSNRAPEVIQAFLDRNKTYVGENNPFFGKKHSEESRKQMSCTRRGITEFDRFISYDPYCIKFNFDLRERVREFYGRECVMCGKDEIENKQRLDVHHVNYDKMACCNDTKPLFVPLCKSCHTTITNKGINKYEDHFTKLIEEEYGGECFAPKLR